MVKRALLVVLALLAATESLHSQDKARGGRKPLVVLLSQNPWLNAVGSDSPRFAFYDDGLVVFCLGSRDGESAEYVSTVLSEADRVALVTSLRIGKAFHDLGDHYAVNSATCQRTYALHVWDHG